MPILHAFHIPVQFGDLHSTNPLLNFAVRTVSRLGVVQRPSWRRGHGVGPCRVGSSLLKKKKKKVSCGLREMVQEEGSMALAIGTTSVSRGLRAEDRVRDRGRVGSGS